MLGTLAFGKELSGYDIKKWADASLGFFYWSPALSHIYRELARLEERSLVEGIEAAPGPRKRRAFRITAAGREALAEWVGQSDGETTVLKHPVALRLWLGHVGATGLLAALLRDHIAGVDTRLDELDRSIEHSRSDPTMRYPNAVLRWARLVHDADRAGAVALLAEIES